MALSLVGLVENGTFYHFNLHHILIANGTKRKNCKKSSATLRSGESCQKQDGGTVHQISRLQVTFLNFFFLYRLLSIYDAN